MFAIVAGFLLACMVVYPGEVAAAASRGLLVWATAVLPALFPFMVCCQLVAGSKAMALLGAPFGAPMRRLLGCPGEAAPLVFLGLLGGSPSGARMIAGRAGAGALSGAQAERLACLTGTVSPMFLLGALPAWAGIPSVGGLLLGVHWAGALIAGLIAARVLCREEPASAAHKKRPSEFAVKQISFGEAVSAAAQAMLTVGGCIVLGEVASSLVARLLPRLPPVTIAGIHAVLEMAGGSADLAALGIPRRALVCALAAIPSFGGLSILAQNLAFLSPVGVRALPVVLTRVLHSALAAALAWLISPLLGIR